MKISLKYLFERFLKIWISKNLLHLGRDIKITLTKKKEREREREGDSACSDSSPSRAQCQLENNKSELIKKAISCFSIAE